MVLLKVMVNKVTLGQINIKLTLVLKINSFTRKRNQIIIQKILRKTNNIRKRSLITFMKTLGNKIIEKEKGKTQNNRIINKRNRRNREVVKL